MSTAGRTRVGRYELGRTLGECTFAKVKYARDVTTGDALAIKVLDKEQVLRHKMVEQIKREISTMKLIKHPNFVRLHEVIARKTRIYLVLEFVDGGELFDKIAKHGRHGEDEARRYFQQLINAVDYCHSRGVYHRDLKIYKADVNCPSWFSSGATKLIHRILDPNTMTRITILEILEDEWFKKGCRPPYFENGDDVSFDDVHAVFNDSQDHLVTERKEKPETMNAFELICRSEGFNLGNLFEKQTMKLQGDKSGRKGHLSVATEVFEVVPSFYMVELRKAGGDTVEFHKFYKNFKTGIKDIVWKPEANGEETKGDAK